MTEKTKKWYVIFQLIIVSLVLFSNLFILIGYICTCTLTFAYFSSYSEALLYRKVQILHSIHLDKFHISMSCGDKNIISKVKLHTYECIQIHFILQPCQDCL